VTFSPEVAENWSGSNAGDTVLAVVVRFYFRQQYSVIALLESLKVASNIAHVALKVYLVPTQIDGQTMSFARRIASERGIEYVDTSEVLSNRSKFEDLCRSGKRYSVNDQALLVCTRFDVRCLRAFLYSNSKRQEFLFQKICADNEGHYLATDSGLSRALKCQECSHILVTNADNLYSPNFLKYLFYSTANIILYSFFHFDSNAVVHAYPKLGNVDLGGMIFDKHLIVAKNMSFIKSIPVPVEPRYFHDADWHFLKSFLAKTHILLVQVVHFFHL
jgi:hypothetical protein